MAPTEPRAHTWAKASEPRGEAGFNAFADVQSKCHAFIRVELDRRVARPPEHFAVELAAGTVKKCPMDSARLVGPDIPKEGHHTAHRRAIKFERPMKPDYFACNVITQREGARGQIVGGHGAARISCLIPDP